MRIGLDARWIAFRASLTALPRQPCTQPDNNLSSPVRTLDHGRPPLPAQRQAIGLLLGEGGQPRFVPMFFSPSGQFTVEGGAGIRAPASIVFVLCEFRPCVLT